MRNTSRERFIATSVLVAFEDGSVYFRIPRGATLADVLENRDKIGKKHRGRPLSIDVRFRTPKASGRGRVVGHPLKTSLALLAPCADRNRSLLHYTRKGAAVMILVARDPVKKPGPWAVAHLRVVTPSGDPV